MKRLALLVALFSICSFSYAGTSTIIALQNPPRIVLAWDSVPQPQPCPVRGFNVYRKLVAPPNMGSVQEPFTDNDRINAAPVVPTGYTDLVVENGKSYWYTVRTVSDGMTVPPGETNPCPVESANSNIVSGDVAAPVLQPLPAPMGISVNCSASPGTSVMASVNWQAVPNATDYWTRAAYTDNSIEIAAAWKNGGNPQTNITFPVDVNRQVNFWAHGYNAAYPPADPNWPMGVGDTGHFLFTCGSVGGPPPIPTNLTITGVQP